MMASDESKIFVSFCGEKMTARREDAVDISRLLRLFVAQISSLTYQLGRLQRQMLDRRSSD
jgi:hypothetical protein